jgi:predicted RNA-binding protein with PIN domain
MVQAELAQAVRAEPAAPEGPAGAPVDAGLDRAAVAGLVAEAAAAVRALQRAMAALESATGEPDAAPEGEAGAAGEREPAAARRRPVPLPPAVFDDSPEAAEHLVRVPGVLVLVDGYNISNAQWHGLAPAEQRSRLLDACAELHARTGVEVEVVFDGSGDQPGGGSLVRAAVRYRFTPEGTEADDDILARIAGEPPARPIVVVTSDRRVREGARLLGANLLGARQFLHAVRR